MRIRKGLGAIALLASVGLLAVGCSNGGGDAPEPEPTETSDSLDALIEAAQAEGSVVWYSGSEERSAAAAAEAFEEEYGIPVTVVRLTSGPLAQRVEAEAATGSPQADVISTVNSVFFESALDQGITAPINEENVPNLADFPSDYILGEAAVVFGIGPDTVSWNTDIADVEITGWEDLINPAFEGEIILVDPRSSSAWADLWSAVLNDPELGPDFIEEFAAQGIRHVADSASPGAQLLAAGEGAVLVASTLATQIPLVEAGAPLKDVILENPAPTYMQYLALVNDAPHTAAGTLFMNWILTEEAQDIYNGVHLQASPLGNLPNTVPLPEGIIFPNSEASAADLPEILRLLGLE